jgi:hypothetical protein
MRSLEETRIRYDLVKGTSDLGQWCGVVFLLFMKGSDGMKKLLLYFSQLTNLILQACLVYLLPRADRPMHPSVARQ